MPSETKTVMISIELDAETAWQLAQFVKRASFNTCLRLTDGGCDEAEAYQMITGLTAVQRGLREAGFAPR